MTFKRIEIQECKDLMAGEDVCVLDIRDPQAFEQGCIDKALHIEQLNMDDFVEQQAKEKPLVIYCYHGNSSLSAAEFFVEKGFTAVHSLNGGYEAWRNS